MRRVAAFLGGLVLALVVAGIAVAVADRKTLVEQGIESALRRQGIAEPHVAVQSVGFRKLRLGPVRLGEGGAVSARSVVIGYVPLALAQGRLRSVAIEGLRAQVEVESGKIHVIGLPAGGAGGGGGARPAIGAIALDDARIELLAPTGEAELVANGTYAPEGARFTVAFEAPNGESRIKATLATTGPADRPHFALDASAEIPAESVLWNLAGLPPLSVGGVKLALSAEGTAPGALRTLAARPSLDGMALDVTARVDVPDLDGLAGGLDGLHLDATGRIAGKEGGLAGTADLAATIRKLRRGEVSADDLKLRAPVAFDWRPGDATVRLTEPGRIEAARLAAGSLVFAGPVHWQVTAAKAPLAQLAGGKATFAAKLASDKDVLRVARDGAPLDIALTGTRIALAGDAAASSATFRTTASQPGEAPWIAPLDLDGSVRLAGGTATVAADARDAKGRKVVHLAGAAASDGARADLTLTAGPYDFVPGGLQPAALTPLLGGFGDVRGTAAATLKFRRQGGRSESGGEVTLDRLSFRLGGIAVTGLAGAISLKSLAPLSTPPGQTLTADSVALVAALDRLRARFRLAPGPRLELASAVAGFAGGEIALGPATFGTGAPPRLTVAVRSVKIAPLLQLLDVAGIGGTGVLSGAIPLGFAGGKVTIDNGRLESKGKGVIQVRSEQAAKALAGGGEPAQLVVRALEDFHYDTLTIALDKSASGDAHGVIHLEGANPAVMNAQPFVFNIDVTSNVDKLIDALMQGYRLAKGLATRAAKGAAGAR